MAEKLAENFKKLGLSNVANEQSSSITTRRPPKTLGKGSIPFASMSAAAAEAAPSMSAAAALASNVPPQRQSAAAGLPPRHPGASASAASEAARGENEPYTFNYILQFQIAGYDRQILKTFNTDKGYDPSRATEAVKTIITLLQIPHFRAHSYSANTTETTTTRYYVNKATYLQHVEQNPSVLPFVKSHRFFAFDIPMGERGFALKEGDKLRASKAGGKRRVKRYTRVKRTKKYKTRKYRR